MTNSLWRKFSCLLNLPYHSSNCSCFSFNSFSHILRFVVFTLSEEMTVNELKNSRTRHKGLKIYMAFICRRESSKIMSSHCDITGMRQSNLAIMKSMRACVMCLAPLACFWWVESYYYTTTITRNKKFNNEWSKMVSWIVGREKHNRKSLKRMRWVVVIIAMANQIKQGKFYCH